MTYTSSIERPLLKRSTNKPLGSLDLTFEHIFSVSKEYYDYYSITSDALRRADRISMSAYSASQRISDVFSMDDTLVMSQFSCGILTMREKDDSNEEILFLSCFCTHSDEQGKGYGSELLCSIQQYATENSMDIYLDCEDSKLSFYEKRGFIRDESATRENIMYWSFSREK